MVNQQAIEEAERQQTSGCCYACPNRSTDSEALCTNCYETFKQEGLVIENEDGNLNNSNDDDNGHKSLCIFITAICVIFAFPLLITIIVVLYQHFTKN